MTAKKKNHVEKKKHIEKRKHANGDPLKALTLRRASAHGAYGWVRDLPDARDFSYSAPLAAFAKGLPDKVDLRPNCPPIYDQGQLGSCTANGIGGAIEFDQMKQPDNGNGAYVPSRLFIYYNERAIENTINQDSGAQIRDGIKSVATLGAPPETLWPYDISKFTNKPPLSAYDAGKKDLVTIYSRVAQDLTQMQGCLAEGFPFVFGVTVYDSFESDAVANSGMVPMPTTAETVVGGHCMLAVGYDNAQRMFIVRNSWGTGWGQDGYCMMPFEYFLTPHLASDFWTIRSVSG